MLSPTNKIGIALSLMSMPKDIPIWSSFNMNTQKKVIHLKKQVKQEAINTMLVYTNMMQKLGSDTIPCPKSQLQNTTSTR